MIELNPYEICPFGSFCGFDYDGLNKCQGLDPERSNVFICELWAENYEDNVLKELED